MSESDLGDDIVQDDVPHHITPTAALRTDFKPWHRVRKQFIRDKQWNHEIQHLVQRLRRELQKEEHEWGTGTAPAQAEADEAVPENVRIERPLRCLMLPGDELLDIRSLWQKLEREGCYLRFLGFNNAISSDEQKRQMAVTESAVTQLAKVCRNSHIAGDRFQDIGRNNSQAYRLFRQYGPYDVVNLDLCDSLVPRGVANEMEDNYMALHQLLLHQIRFQKTRWLLFATTQVDRNTANQTEINRLAAPTRKNCDENAAFAAALGQRVPVATFKSDEHAFDISHLDAAHLVEVFGVLLGKWLVSTLALASPRCSVKLLSSYRYVIRADMDVEMLSLGFLITPHYAPPIDSTGISGLQPEPQAIQSELETALDLVSVASRIRDVDEILADDAALRNRLTAEKADLLSAAGYDREAFLRWVADGEAAQA